MEDSLDYILRQPEVIWFFIGLGLMLMEFIVPGLIIIFFGLGCWVTSLGLMLFPNLGLTFQLLLFLGSSIVLLVLLRRKAKSWIGTDKGKSQYDELLEEFVGKRAIAESNIQAGGEGKVSFKGTTWEVSSDSKIKKGDPVRIISKSSIKLKVEPVNN